MKDPVLQKRVLRSRAAYRDKNRGQGELRAKTRVVIIGCGDPDLKQLSRDSPTPTRLSELVILAAATAGANKMFNLDGRQWHLWVSDAKQAFLQGKQDFSERQGLPIFMLSPEDPILNAAGAFPARMYEILGNCYGLSNAPRTWYKKVDGAVRGAGFRQHSFDRCFYWHLGEDGALDCILIVHVDDFLATYSESFPLSVLENLFAWGSITKVNLETPGEYRGKEITMVQDGGKLCYRITQKAFIENMQGGTLPKGRLRQEARLSAEEAKEFKSVCGSLQWLAGQTRPELCAVTSLSNKGNETTAEDLQQLYNITNFVKMTKEQGILFPAIPFNTSTCNVTYTDSSWANAQEYKSQYGAVVTLCPPQVTQKTCNCMLMDWKSGRSPRVCRSTLAAEACAADEGADRSAFLNLFLTELFYQKPAYRGHQKLNSMLCVDAKSLYDCLIAENPALSDRRSMVQVRSVQQLFLPKDVRWLPTQLQHADGLTKIDEKLLISLRAWCERPWSQLVEQRPV